MKRFISIVLLLAGFFLPLQQASARFVQLWSYGELTGQADLVIIGTYDSSKDSGDATVIQGEPAMAVDSSIKVSSVLKGTMKQKTVAVRLFRRNGPDPFVEIDGIPFFTFKKTISYILFLKKRADGKFEPISGETQPYSSFQEMPAEPR